MGTRATKQPAAAAGTTPAAVPPAVPAHDEQAEADRAEAERHAAEHAEAARAEAERLAVEQAEAARRDAEHGGFEMSGRVILVRSIARSGRRRAGIAFGSEPIQVRVDDITEDQLAAILGDSDHLIVSLDD